MIWTSSSGRIILRVGYTYGIVLVMSIKRTGNIKETLKDPFMPESRQH